MTIKETIEQAKDGALCSSCFNEGTSERPLIQVDYTDLYSGVIVHCSVHEECAGQSSKHTLVTKK